MSTVNKQSEAYKKQQEADAKKLINPKAAQLGEAITKHLGERAKKLNKQPSAIANGGLDKIIKTVCERVSDKTPNVKLVALVTVLGQCGSRPTEKDKAIK